MSVWLLTCECGHTYGVHAFRAPPLAVCLDADCPCTTWTPETMVLVVADV